MIHNTGNRLSFDDMIAAAPDKPPAGAASPMESVTARPVAAASATMSSLQIAEITGKEHKNVLADIRRVLDEAEIEGAKFLASLKMPSGQTASVYHLPRRECDLVVSGYSVKYRLAIIDRWQELEAKQAAPAVNLNDPAFLRSLLLDNVEKVLALESKVSDLTPKAEALDRIATADGSMCITDAAKALQLRPKDLFAWLDREGWTYRRHGNRERVPYQHRIQSGDMECKAYTYQDSNGDDTISERALITAKGLTTLAKKIREVAA